MGRLSMLDGIGRESGVWVALDVSGMFDEMTGAEREAAETEPDA